MAGCSWLLVFARRRSHGLLRSVQLLDRRDRHQILHGIGEVPIERNQRVGLELGQGDVLGGKGVRPSEQASGLPCDVLKDEIFDQPDRQPVHVAKLPLGILPSQLTAAPEPGSDVRPESRPGREPGERRRPGQSRTWSWKIGSPQLLRYASARPQCGMPGYLNMHVR